MISVFVDSNVVIYTLDRLSPAKNAMSKAWLNRLATAGQLTMSVQVLNEVYASLTLRQGLHPVRDGVRALLDPLVRFADAPLDVQVMRQAWALQDRYQLRIWDALLMASANVAGCSHFLSEDLNDGQRYGEVSTINPFRHAPEDVLGPALP